MAMNKREVKKFSKDSLRQVIARNIRATRENVEPKMTQDQVANLFDPPMSRASVAQWEIGDTLPDIDRLAILSKAFGVTIDSLVFGDDVGEVLTPDALKVARKYMALDEKRKLAFFSLLQSFD